MFFIGSEFPIDVAVNLVKFVLYWWMWNIGRLLPRGRRLDVYSLYWITNFETESLHSLYKYQVLVTLLVNSDIWFIESFNQYHCLCDKYHELSMLWHFLAKICSLVVWQYNNFFLWKFVAKILMKLILFKNLCHNLGDIYHILQTEIYIEVPKFAVWISSLLATRSYSRESD